MEGAQESFWSGHQLAMLPRPEHVDAIGQDVVIAKSMDTGASCLASVLVFVTK